MDKTKLELELSNYIVEDIDMFIKGTEISREQFCKKIILQSLTDKKLITKAVGEFYSNKLKMANEYIKKLEKNWRTELHGKENLSDENREQRKTMDRLSINIKNLRDQNYQLREGTYKLITEKIELVHYRCNGCGHGFFENSDVDIEICPKCTSKSIVQGTNVPEKTNAVDCPNLQCKKPDESKTNTGEHCNKCFDQEE